MMTVRDKSYGSVVWNKQTCQDMRNLTWFYQYHVCNTKTAASYTTANEGYHYISNLICFSNKNTEGNNSVWIIMNSSLLPCVQTCLCMCISIVISIIFIFFNKTRSTADSFKKKARRDYKSMWLNGKCDLITSSPIFPVIYPIAPLSKLYANKKQKRFRLFLQTLLCWLAEVSESYTTDYTICSNYIVLI